MNTEYFSHMPILAASVSITSGPVLELGAGYGSTLMLHGICGAMNRSLTTLETDHDWIMKFVNYGRSWHRIKRVVDFHDIEEYHQDWGMVFVDHGIMEQRGHSVRMLNHIPIIIAHDTCHPWLYDYEPTLSEFRYRWDFKIEGPRTTVVSNTINVAKEFAKLCL